MRPGAQVVQIAIVAAAPGTTHAGNRSHPIALYWIGPTPSACRAQSDAVRRPSVQIDTRQYADATVAAPHGRIDHRSAAGFDSALAPLIAGAAARRGALVIDFAAVDYISSVGLRALMVASRELRAAEALLAVAALQSVVAEIFAISRFDKVLTVCASLDDALALCSGAARAAWRAGGGGR